MPILSRHSASRASRTHSESEAWRDVKDLATRIRSSSRGMDLGQCRNAAAAIADICDAMLAQLKKGIHENPPLTVFSLMNPPKGMKRIDHRLLTIDYEQIGTKKKFFHDFKPGTHAYAMPDGTIVIHRPGAKVWVELPY